MKARAIALELPRVLANLVGLKEIAGEGATLGAVLDDITAREPGLRTHFFDEAGELRRHIRFIKNDEFWRHRDPLVMPLAPGDRVTIINSVSGG